MTTDPQGDPYVTTTNMLVYRHGYQSKKGRLYHHPQTMFVTVAVERVFFFLGGLHLDLTNEW